MAVTLRGHTTRLFVLSLLCGGCTALNPSYSEATDGSTTKEGPGATTDGSVTASPTTTPGTTDPSATDPSATDPSVTDATTVDASSTGSASDDVTTDTQACADDVHEEDDDAQQAVEQGAVPPGTYDGVVCPADPDWRFIELVEPWAIRVDLLATKDGAEVVLFDGELEVLDAKAEPEGFVSRCLPPGDYFVRVSAPDNDVPIIYGLTLDLEPCLSEACCESSLSCPDPEVAGCVCMEDPFCCESVWDALCIETAVSQCKLDCV